MCKQYLHYTGLDWRGKEGSTLTFPIHKNTKQNKQKLKHYS